MPYRPFIVANYRCQVDSLSLYPYSGPTGGHIISKEELKTLPYYPLEICIDLTSEGLHAAPGLGMGVVQCIFDYISILCAQGPQKWFWLEKKAINDLKFQCAPVTLNLQGPHVCKGSTRNVPTRF
jgi:hypothetical protein